MKLIRCSLPHIVILYCLSLIGTAHADWTQFRGPNGSGVAEKSSPPVHFGPDQNVIWKTAIPEGVSSPVVSGDRIFITALEDGRLLTLCLDRGSGEILWRRSAPDVALESFHGYANQAASTPATDGERLYVYFGSYGMLAYTFEGETVWERAFPTPPSMFGTSTSPILYRDLVILQRDGMSTESNLLALDAQTGETRWEVKRPIPGQSYSTPMVWHQERGDELIVIGKGVVAAFDPLTGEDRWQAQGMTFTPIAVAVAGEDLLFASSTGTGDPADPLVPPTWSQLLEYDANGDNEIVADEIPEDYVLQVRKELPIETEGNSLSIRWLAGAPMVDSNQDGRLTEDEWKGAVKFFNSNRDTVVGIRPGGRGEITETHVAWKEHRGVSEMPSPLYYRERLYFIRNGGLLTSYDPATGARVLDRERIGDVGQYVMSPIAADGRVYFGSDAGTLVVVEAGDTLNVLARNKLGERLLATPAVVDDTLIVRTQNHLWAFGAE